MCVQANLFWKRKELHSLSWVFQWTIFPNLKKNKAICFQSNFANYVPDNSKFQRTPREPSMILTLFRLPRFPSSGPKMVFKWHILRTPVRKYREFRDSTKNSNFFLFFQKVPFGELFSKKNIQKVQRVLFFEKRRKFENATRSAQIADGN